MARHIHDGRSHCEACALEEIGRQHKEIADLRQQLAEAQGKANEAKAEQDKWRGIADCREFDGFLGPSGEPECQGGDDPPSEPMCLTHKAEATERREKRVMLALEVLNCSPELASNTGYHHYGEVAWATLMQARADYAKGGVVYVAGRRMQQLREKVKDIRQA